MAKQVMVLIGLVFLAVGVFFGLKPVIDYETSSDSLGEEVECGSAWSPNDAMLTTFGQAECRKNGLDDNKTYSFLALGVGLLLAFGGLTLSSSSTTTVKCPFCAELISPEAIVCRHCGRELMPTVDTGSSAEGGGSPAGGTPEEGETQ